MSTLYQAAAPLPDIQKTPDARGVAIDQVGICDVSFPITVLDQQNQKQQASARLSISVSLPHHFKGTHMSRFLEILSRHQGEITMRTIPEILHELKCRLDAESAHIEVEFPYYIRRTAPVSGLSAPMEYRSTFIAESNGVTDDFLLRVVVPVTTLCPCSKEISDYGAHNQRGYVTLTVRPKKTDAGEMGRWAALIRSNCSAVTWPVVTSLGSGVTVRPAEFTITTPRVRSANATRMIPYPARMAGNIGGPGRPAGSFPRVLGRLHPALLPGDHHVRADDRREDDTDSERHQDLAGREGHDAIVRSTVRHGPRRTLPLPCGSTLRLSAAR